MVIKLKKRIISAIIMTLIVIPFIIIGGNVFNIGISILSILAFKELMNLNDSKDYPLFIKIISLICILFLINYKNTNVDSLLYIPVWIISSIIVLLFIPVVFDIKNYNSNKAFKMLANVLFLGITFNLLISTYNYNLKYFLLLIVICIFTDMFALFGGKLFGKHNFTDISPNKTIEGCISGSLVAVIVSAIFYYFFISKHLIIIKILIILLLSIVGQVGDLFFSKIKRDNNIKDFSNLIPGHGGILDRLDSFTFVLLMFSIVFTLL